MDPATYWRLRYLQCDAERRTAVAQLEVARAVERYHLALTVAGIAPDEPYRWDDQAQSVQPLASTSEETAP